MQLLGDEHVYSASDLNNFLACEHLTALELAAMHGGPQRPKTHSKTGDLLGAIGAKHEARYVQDLRESGIEVVSIERVDSPDLDYLAQIKSETEQTRQAMRLGRSIIYQATFFDGTWLGHADILRRIETPSALGAYSYEVEDTKLARGVQPYFLVQLCFYSQQVASVQGLMPELMHVVLGDSTTQSFRVSDFAPYYRFVRNRFLERISPAAGDGSTTETYPYPVPHCGYCRWDPVCAQKRVDDDHLSAVHDLTKLQEGRLRKGGIATLAALAAATPEQRPNTMDKPVFTRLSRQARVQFEQREAVKAGQENPYRYELLPIDPEAVGPRGFALLPEASPGDVFFDMEGDPFYDIEHGLEYLFGAYTIDEGFRAFWGCDRTAGPPNDRLAEKRAFEAFVDFVMARREKHPDMHVYHYASYEVTALKSLMQQHGTREIEIDILLREQRLVDLYRVVEQTVVIGQPSYSLKKVEAFFGGREDGAIAKGDESIIQFESWLESRHETPSGDAQILKDIEDYNERDCISTKKLLDWLYERRSEFQRKAGMAIGPFPAAPIPEPDPEPDDPYAELKLQLEAAIPADFDPAQATSRSQPVYTLWLALQTLEYHWRERKPELWAFHDRCKKYSDDPEGLLDNREIIVGLEPSGDPLKVKRSMVQRYRFPAQELNLDTGQAYDAATKEKTGTVESIEEHDGYGILYLKRGDSVSEQPVPKAIIVRNEFSSKPLRKALARLAQALLAGVSGEMQHRAAHDLLTAAPPRLRSRAAGSTLQPEDVNATSILELIENLDNSYLFIQGPPGSGKTYQGANAIVSLLEAGKRVGVTANSHAAINNLLAAVEEVAEERGVVARGQRKVSDEEKVFVSRLGGRSAIQSVKDFILCDGTVFAGTAWAFAPDRMVRSLDYLFIDEAGQVSLPNALVGAMAAKSVVLLGDPLQLPQVRHASHPGDVGTSVLEYLLIGAQVGRSSETETLRPVAPDRGVLLNRTWRMHSDACSFISTLMYEGRLTSIDRCNLQRIDVPGLPHTGVLFKPVIHADGKVRSVSEAAVVSELVEQILGSEVTDHKGSKRRLEPSDIMVVTPYNMQRRCIEKALLEKSAACGAVKVGTVDKFQGQEADVVIFSTATANPEDAPRGIEFLFDRNRLNVAISRARALAIYVGSPALREARPTSVKRVLALSAGCALVEAGLSESADSEQSPR